MARRLVITSAFAYGPEALWPLLHSLQMHVPDVDVLVFSSDRDVERLALLQERLPFLRLEPVAFPPQVIRGRLALARKLMVRGRRKLRRIRQFSLRDPSVAIERQVGAGLSTLDAHFLIRRFFWARQSLEGLQGDQYDHVMLCDVRDVVVQRDPFAGLSNRLVSGEEYQFLRNCPMNRGWIRQAYGPDGERSLLAEKILCAGVTLGSTEQLRLYLQLFCDDVLAVMARARSSCLINLDQAIHNHVIRSALIEPGQGLAFTPSPVDGLIATLGNVPISDIGIDPDSGVVRVMGSVPAVLHQYDRHPQLEQHIARLHAAPAAVAAG